MYLGKGADHKSPETLPMVTGGQCSESMTGQDPTSGFTIDILLKAAKQCHCLFLWTTFFLELASAGHVRGLQGIHMTGHALLRFKIFRAAGLRFTAFLKI